MPFVRGFLRIRRAGHPGQPLPPGEEGPVDPGWGVEEGDGSEVEPPPLPDPPPGIWPPPVPAHPIQPVPPGDPAEPGAIWPPPGGLGKPLPKPPPPQPGQPLPKNYMLVLAKIPGYGWHYIVVDVNAIMGRYPDQGLPPGIPPREPK